MGETLMPEWCFHCGDNAGEEDCQECGNLFCLECIEDEKCPHCRGE